MAKTRTYFCIDMKSFYASVECAERGYNPFGTNLVVADLTRGKNALCLAITPAMKAQGIRNRCRLSEIPSNVKYEVAPPRMALYIEYAADIYSLYLDYRYLCGFVLQRVYADRQHLKQDRHCTDHGNQFCSNHKRIHLCRQLHDHEKPHRQRPAIRSELLDPQGHARNGNCKKRCQYFQLHSFLQRAVIL